MGSRSRFVAKEINVQPETFAWRRLIQPNSALPTRATLTLIYPTLRRINAMDAQSFLQRQDKVRRLGRLSPWNYATS